MKTERTRRKVVARLDNGKLVTMIAMEPMTDSEAGQAIRDKFRRGGKLILKECGNYVSTNN